MGEFTGISYVHHTRNFWKGCTRVGPGCDNCYAEATDKRWGGGHWGPGKPRIPFLEGAARDLKGWNRLAGEAGEIRRVFVNTWSDWADAEAPDEWRTFLFQTIKPLEHLRILLVSKRGTNFARMLPADWGVHGYPNVWLIHTICNQDEAVRDIPRLLEVPAALHGISAEPLLGQLRLRPWLKLGFTRRLDWVIVGGESGAMHKARPFNVDAAEDLVLDCKMNGVPVYVKQMGRSPYSVRERWSTVGATIYDAAAHGMSLKGFKVVPNLKDGHGIDTSEWPEALKVQEVPSN